MGHSARSTTQGYVAGADPQVRQAYQAAMTCWSIEISYFLLAQRGLRLSELLDLKRGDVDLAGQRLRIEEAKGRRDRVVYLSQACVQALERYLAGQPAGPEVALLCHPSGQGVSYRWVQERVRQWGEEIGVVGVSPHRLRHTFATRLIK
jgi:integrase/recombinase XerD